MTLNEIRAAFLKFFEAQDHQILPSSSLIPHNDPSLMFTNSGMVQFKNIFLGLEEAQNKRVTTSQKCVRAGGKHNDLDMVGYTTRHHTFFEMLGNFSFGDYFKAEAIEMAWDFLTNVLKINKDKLYITVYHTDDYAFSTWKKVAGLDDNKIIRIDTNDNFWSMGNTGPCGPCSEIFFDHGENYLGGLPGSGIEGDRYVEIWNLVFMQNEQFNDGSIGNLPKPSIDTGIGLERLTAVMQGVNDNFAIDIFKNIIAVSQEISGNKSNIAAHKIIADHLRAMSFLINDGVLPSNDGRGYVLRRIMRRAMRYVQNIGYKKPFLHQLVHTLVTVMSHAYPELQKSEHNIQSVIYNEEIKFGETLERGLKILQEEISSVRENRLSGSVAFKLYDTYGFPLDLTKDILRSQNISVDELAFDAAMNEQKVRARKAWSGSGEKSHDKIWFELADKFGSTEFFGYTCDAMSVKVIGIIVDGKAVNEIQSTQDGIIILNQTPFYGESGGQIGDTGFVHDSFVYNTIIYPGKIIGHHIKCQSRIAVLDEIYTSIDRERRNKIKCNHSATHLLHKALQDKFGAHVTQKGSLVNDQKLRFDFTHNTLLNSEEINQIEFKVNQMIQDNKSVITKIMGFDEAVQDGAMALFGEKYADEVRVISMCNSIELCGGTHVNATGDIGIFKIISESAIASGIRRIEAVTGMTAIEYCNSKYIVINKLTSLIKCSEEQIIGKVTTLYNENKAFSKQLTDLMIDNIVNNFIDIEINGRQFTIQEGIDADVQIMRSAVLKLKTIDKIVILINNSNNLIISVPKSLHHITDAKKLSTAICDKFGGKGGGSPDLVQLGNVSITQSLSNMLAKIVI